MGENEKRRYVKLSNRDCRLIDLLSIGWIFYTASEMGCAHLDNGPILNAAELEFDVFITTDKQLRYQQNLKFQRERLRSGIGRRQQLFELQLYIRNVLLEELELALEELPEEQRTVFVAHELEGRSFKEIAAETGVSVNTLLSLEERCEHLTPEERERFRQRMRERLGFGPSAESKEQ